MAKRPRKGYCLGPEVRIQLRLQQLADDGGRNVLPRSICRRVVGAEKESGVVLSLKYELPPRPQTPHGACGLGAQPQPKTKTTMPSSAVEGCCRQGRRGSPFSATSVSATGCYVSHVMHHMSNIEQGSGMEAAQDDVLLLGRLPG